MRPMVGLFELAEQRSGPDLDYFHALLPVQILRNSWPDHCKKDRLVSFSHSPRSSAIVILYGYSGAVNYLPVNAEVKLSQVDRMKLEVAKLDKLKRGIMSGCENDPRCSPRFEGLTPSRSTETPAIP